VAKRSCSIHMLPNSALDRDRDTVEACRLVLGMRCRPGYKNVYLVERCDEGSKSRSNRPPGPSAGIYSTIAPVSVGALRDNGVERGLRAFSLRFTLVSRAPPDQPSD
jgi:hypothetical protein